MISAEIGLGKIVRALLTGSINVDLAFYLMQDGGYPEDPHVRRSVKVEFDLGSGTISVPLNLLHDLDFDGREGAAPRRRGRSWSCCRKCRLPEAHAPASSWTMSTAHSPSSAVTCKVPSLTITVSSVVRLTSDASVCIAGQGN